MKKTICTTLMALVLLGFASTLQAQETKQAPEGAKELKLEKVDYVPATTVNFPKELGVKFSGLVTLGARIETALLNCDPVELAACGLELKAAEVASGKTAACTSEKILEKAFEIATLRSDVSELKAVKTLLPEKAKELDASLALMENSSEKLAGASRGFNTLHVDNESHSHLFVYINHRNVGCVHEHEHADFGSGMCPHSTVCVEIKEQCGHIVYRAIVRNAYNDFFVRIPH